MDAIRERGYQDSDLSLLQATIAGWIRSSGKCGYCHTGDVAHRYYNGGRGRIVLEQYSRIWEQSGAVVAFIQCNPYWSGFDAYVAPHLRGSDLEREALSRGYDLTRQGMNAIDRAEKAVATDVDACDEWRRDLLLEAGFTPEESPWLSLTQRPLHLPIPDAVLPEGFLIRQAQLSDAEQLASVHSSAFGSNWTADEYRDQVMLKPGYTAEYEWVVVAPDGQFAAFTVTWLDRVNCVGLFEPVGVHTAFQRKGLGRALMAQVMQWMVEQGMEHAEVGHELDNPASSGLYAGLGFERITTVTGYTKP
jgi:ribosomal protein S18 acetylase RimI-like enzyme